MSLYDKMESVTGKNVIDWSERTVSNRVNVEKFRVCDVMEEYCEGALKVNRKYQRKLVWRKHDKQLLIDSMMMKIPLPTFLFAKFEVAGKEYLEIIDGLQRLNAIVSFVLGDFGIEYEGRTSYFDLTACNETLYLWQEGKLQQKEPVLPRKMCKEFDKYPLSVTLTGQDDVTIMKIFDRINSTGRKLSSHDLRQSRSAGDFPDLVRRVASCIRGEHCPVDRVDLSDMPKISVGDREDGYGISIEDSFWKRHGIISASGLRESKDEEVVETILADILLGGKFRKNRDSLDDLYDEGTKLGREIKRKVQEKGKQEIEDSVIRTFDVIDSAFRAINSDFTSSLFETPKAAGKDECFRVLFVAVHKLLEEGYVAVNYEGVGRQIVAAQYEIKSILRGKSVKREAMPGAISNVHNILSVAFTKQMPSVPNPFEEKLDKLLSYSKLESQLIDYKIGISDFDSMEVNLECVHGVAKTLTAIANTAAEGEVGYVVIGIADTVSAYNDWFRKYRGQSVTINQRIVVGVEAESNKLFGSMDKYLGKLRRELRNEPMPEELKNYVLENFHSMSYHGLEIIVIPSKGTAKECLYDGKKYVRNGNETVLFEED